MDQKSPLWKRSAEKSLATDRRANHSHLISNGEEDDAIKGCQKSETEALNLKKDLQKEKYVYEARITHLEKALMNCTQQLDFVRNEQETRLHTAIIKTSQEHEKTRIAQDEKLSEAIKKITRLEAENTQFKKSLLKKDRVVEELSRYRSQAEADLKALVTRLESTEKENASLKYEIRVLEKEIEIRHEERLFDLQTAEAAQKKHKESLDKISRLESECQKLRVLVQKRLPGPAAFMRMKNEIESSRRVNLSQRSVGSIDFHSDVAFEGSTKMIDFLRGQLQRMEEENTRLKHELSKGKKAIDQCDKYPFFSQEQSPASLSDLDSDKKGSCAGSWASALITELENFKNEKKLNTPSHGYMGTQDMNLMDDFAQMEKFAHSPAASEHVSQTWDKNNFLTSEAHSSGNENINSLTAEKSAHEFHMIVPLKRILELLQEINVINQDGGSAESLPGKADIGKFLPCKDLETHVVRVFQCERGEVSAVLQQFVQTCNNLLGGEADIEQFAQSVASNLEWFVSHSFSLQDVTSMKDYGGLGSQSAESSELSLVTSAATRLNLQSEDKELLVEGLEGRQQSQIKKVESFRIQLKDLNDIIKHSQSEKPIERESAKNNSGDQTGEQKIMNQDSQAQLVETNFEYSKPCKGALPGENDWDNNCKSFEELEETCYNQKKRLDGERGSKDVLNEGKQLQNGVEITLASEKLAECQETLRNLGKQLKGLASPKDAFLFEKVVSTPVDLFITSMPTPKGNGSQRLSLRDKMIAEDNNIQIDVSPRTKDATQNGHDNSTNLNKIGHAADRSAIVHKSIVPSKKKESKSFLLKLIWWKKRGNGKKTPFP